MPLALLEPPASFEELAVTGAEVVRWTSARARGPVSLVTLRVFRPGCSQPQLPAPREQDSQEAEPDHRHEVPDARGG